MSVDSFLGLPFNIASYSILTEMVAQCVNMEANEFHWVGGCTHIYNNHLEQVAEQLSREPFEQTAKLVLADKKDIFDFKFEDISIIDYVAHPSIKAPVAV